MGLKFAILREFKIKGKNQKKVYVEWSESDICDVLYNKVLQKLDQTAANKFKKIWDDTIKEFKKESIKIP